MLLNLRIRDFAIIDALELDFERGFTVVTGETGAGKSILVDALTLALGGRASADVVRTGADAAEVEAVFDVSKHDVVRTRLAERELTGDDPGLLVVRRVVGAKGRAKVLVNGRLATAATLAEMVRGLVDISGQHDQQSLLVVDAHTDILDGFGRCTELAGEYRRGYAQLGALVREAAALRGNDEALLQRADFLRFQLEEIARIAPVDGEDERLEAERQRLAHAEKLREGASLAEALVYGEDGSAFDKLGKAAAEVAELARIDSDLESVSTALASAQRELQEAARTLQRYSDRVESDPARLAEIDDRLNELRRLCRKHGGRVVDVLARRLELAAELEKLDRTDSHAAELAQAIEREQQQLAGLAARLTLARQQAATALVDAVVRELADMELAGAVFEVRIEPRTGAAESFMANGVALGPTGADAIEFLWGPNRGETPKSLAKIASGGELSRLMLAVKTVLSQQDLVSLYVFDEVDTGLGGRAADAIGRKIQAVARDHQAITVTHLAPIAARADHHYTVTKEVRGERTVSVLERVVGGAREVELARMIDGGAETNATQQAARDMLARAQGTGEASGKGAAKPPAHRPTRRGGGGRAVASRALAARG